QKAERLRDKLSRATATSTALKTGGTAGERVGNETPENEKGRPRPPFFVRFPDPGLRSVLALRQGGPVHVRDDLHEIDLAQRDLEIGDGAAAGGGVIRASRVAGRARAGPLGIGGVDRIQVGDGDGVAENR